MKFIGGGVLHADADLAVVAQGQMAGGGGAEDAGKVCEAIENLLLHLVSAGCVRIPLAIEHGADNESALRVESDGSVEQAYETAH